MSNPILLLSLLLFTGLPPADGLADLQRAGVSSFPPVDDLLVGPYLPLPEPAGEGLAEDVEEEEENADLPRRPLEVPDRHVELLRLARPAAHPITSARIRSPRSPPAAG